MCNNVAIDIFIAWFYRKKYFGIKFPFFIYNIDTSTIDKINKSDDNSYFFESLIQIWTLDIFLGKCLYINVNTPN